jgi:hypothetical protein
MSPCERRDLVRGPGVSSSDSGGALALRCTLRQNTIEYDVKLILLLQRRFLIQSRWV